MRNRAKCKLCHSIIESYHPEDYVTCRCEEIAVDGGLAMRCFARTWDNFLRIDDEGNEIVVKIEESSKYDIADMEPYPFNTPRKCDVKPLYMTEKPTRDSLLKELDTMIENIDKLPQHAKSGPVNHYDLGSSLILLSEILRCDRTESN